MKYIKKTTNKEVIFTNVFGLDFFPPKPAVKEVPNWYKNTPEYIGDQGKKIVDPSFSPQTIKKCIPVFDAITAGYILYTQVDVQIDQREGIPYYIWPEQNAIGFHPIDQAPIHPEKKEAPYPKWINPYAITTPPGYSVLFTQPMHRESVFTILDGIVDTDTYKAPVNFPFVLKDIKWEGIIPAGTPMAQIIPFKRESWKHKIGSEKEQKEQSLVTSKLKTIFFNSYKLQFWSRKEYK
jgi:hypothetical protein